MAVGAVDIVAVSGITGSISIACWVVVFSPQIIENFRRSSAEGLSIVFVVVWLLGDVFNILGAVLQGVLPTMIILAVYYTLADIVLLAQCFYYRGFTLSDAVKPPAHDEPTEQSALLPSTSANGSPAAEHGSPLLPSSRRASSTFREHMTSIDGTHFSPVVPLHNARDLEAIKARSPAQKRSAIAAVFFNATAVVVVCLAGALGWYLSQRAAERHRNRHHHHSHNPAPPHDDDDDATLHFNVLGQVFGYVCAVLYLGSRLPQLLLNYRRKSTDGVSMLFFLFACIGNLTYVVSIVAYEPACRRARDCADGEAAATYGRYFLVNLSWLIGSFGTLLLDAGVFIQYFMYKDRQAEGSAVVD